MGKEPLLFEGTSPLTLNIFPVTIADWLNFFSRDNYFPFAPTCLGEQTVPSEISAWLTIGTLGRMNYV